MADDARRPSELADELRRLPIEALVSNAKPPTCLGMRMCTAPSVLRAHEVDQASPTAWRLFQLVTELELQTHPGTTALVSAAGGIDFSPEDLIPEFKDALLAWTTTLSDPEIGARVHDVLWLCKHRGADSFKSAISASEFYVDAARRLFFEPNAGYDAVARVRRSLQLAKSINHFEAIAPRVVSLVHEVLAKGSSSWSSSLLDVAGGFDVLAASEVAAIARDLANGAHGNVAESLWLTAAHFADAAEGANGSPTALGHRRSAAQVRLAQADAARDRGEHLVEAIILRDAVPLLQRAAMAERVPEVLERARVATQAINPTTRETCTDLHAACIAVRDHVSGLTVEQAVLKLVELAAPPDVDQLRASSVSQIAASPAFRLTGLRLMTDGGLQDRMLGPVSVDFPHDDNEADAGVVEAHMSHVADQVHRQVATRLIQHAVSQMAHEHAVTIQHTVRLTMLSALVPPGHRQLFARGLLAGFRGDFVVAVHLLVPQLEQALRTLMQDHYGVALAAIDHSGSQAVNLLGRVLSTEQLVVLLGRNTVWELRMLLADRAGSNFRNLLSHGLMGDRGFALAPYVWAWCLRLCVALTPGAKLAMSDEAWAHAHAASPSDACAHAPPEEE